ncbi:MAG: hypothetical protein QM492_03015 [Rhodobacterales bacterium]
MLMTAVILNLVGAAGLFALSLKYLLGSAPADYHAEILKTGGIEAAGPISGLFKTINTVIGSSFLAIALSIAVITWFGVQADILWAKISVLAIGVIAGVPGSEAARRLEKLTSVKTPWRPGYAMTGLTMIAFMLAVL